ncbi:GNAT family N-acetyltransferase [Micromonospora echinospora]|uniref:GNAT family N-acetyltransferase n=1 Tax=Micromonospora echinospora TaxID=1877 RepID=UPI00366F2065
MDIRELTPAGDGAVARALLRIQRAAYAVEAALIGDDRIPTLHETLDDLRAAPLRWLGAVTTGAGSAVGPTEAASSRAPEPADRLVGAVAWTEDATTLDIDRLVVDPVAHRRGVGRMLVGAVLSRAGDRTVVVATGRANRPARALYESSGFTALGDAEPVPGLWITRYARPGRAAATRSA